MLLIRSVVVARECFVAPSSPRSEYGCRRIGMHRHSRTGLTLVELLMAMAIVSLLIGLLLPALQAARQSAWQTRCRNNLRQIGIALNAHHAAQSTFPAGVIEWRRPGDTQQRQLAWSAFLLPYLEEHNVYDILDLSTPFDSPENADGAAHVLSVYICPVSERGRQLVDGRGPIDYGGIYGERITSPNAPPKGILINQPISLRKVSDGASHTLIVAEDTRFGDGQWINGRNVFDQAFAINAAPDFENDIRSDHRGGAQGVMADGSAHFLSEEMDLLVLAALCTRAGREAQVRWVATN